jgi:hypothetical protein
VVSDSGNFWVSSENDLSWSTDKADTMYSRSAAELDELFERKIKPWRFHKTETAIQLVINSSKENQH